jgi:NTE family protein
VPISAVILKSEAHVAAHTPSKHKTHVTVERPPFERIALLLQGGGALGPYQASAEPNLHPDRVAGISIGAVNSALIASKPPVDCHD